MYGGLGNTQSAGLHDTSHYLAPALAWNLPSDWTLRLSSGIGLNDSSHRLLLRWGISREFSGFCEMVRRWFGGQRWKGSSPYCPLPESFVLRSASGWFWVF